MADRSGMGNTPLAVEPRTAYSWGDDPTTSKTTLGITDNSLEGPRRSSRRKNPSRFGLMTCTATSADGPGSNEYTEDGYQWMAGLRILAMPAAQTRGRSSPIPVRSVVGGSLGNDPPRTTRATRWATMDEEWKSEDPNSRWRPVVVHHGPSRGVGFRLFRSAKCSRRNDR